MTKIEDGGPAFPHQMPSHMMATVTGAHPMGGFTPEVATFHFGMSLRDWFAGQALTGIIASPAAIIGHPDTDREATAAVAYEYADAMLAARKNGGAA